jgi:Holliday junction resolvase RusA-like endonuclease
MSPESSGGEGVNVFAPQSRRAREAPMSQRHTLELPLPPSTNDLWKPIAVRAGRRYVGKLVKTPEAKAYARVVALLAKAQRCPLFEGPVRVSLKFWLPSRRSDGDNREKALLDALQGIAYANDRQVAPPLVLDWDCDAKHPRVVVTLEGELSANAKPPRRPPLPVPPARDASEEEKEAWERDGFSECPSCAAKPGAPDLCAGCLERRRRHGQANAARTEGAR